MNFCLKLEGTPKISNNIIKKLFILFGKRIFETSLNGINKNIKNIDNRLNEIILEGLYNIKNKGSNKWVYCNRACIHIAELFKKEIESTLYMLNIISNSLVTIDNSFINFIFDGNIGDLTGIWNLDKDKFTFKIYSKVPLSEKTRLIMGFGPSASGKTQCAKAIINMLSKNDVNFPKSFLSIDGGIYREKSYIYQKLIKLIKQTQFNGLKNLVLSGYSLKISITNKKIIKRHSLFNASIVKKNITDYLSSRKEKISLYIPETLGGCFFNCFSVYKKYIKITNDFNSWIGLLIWQHKTHNDCDYIEGYKCKGCTESGMEREKNEGKKYSSTAWKNSMKNGKSQMMKAPGGRYEIHNGGTKYSKSVIIDHSHNKILKNIPNGFNLPKNIKQLKEH